MRTGQTPHINTAIVTLLAIILLLYRDDGLTAWDNTSLCRYSLFEFLKSDPVHLISNLTRRFQRATTGKYTVALLSTGLLKIN